MCVWKLFLNEMKIERGKPIAYNLIVVKQKEKQGEESRKMDFEWTLRCAKVS